MVFWCRVRKTTDHDRSATDTIYMPINQHVSFNYNLLGTLGDCISWALGKVVVSKRITTRHLTLLNVWKRSRPHSGTFTQQPSLGTKNDDERKEILIPLEENDLIESGVHYVAHYFVNNFELAYFLRVWILNFRFLLIEFALFLHFTDFALFFN